MDDKQAPTLKPSLVYFIGFTLIITTLIWVALSLAPISALQKSESLATWIIAISAIISAITAIFAARYLYQTLQSTEHNTNLLRQQLQQNRAYMVVENADIRPFFDPEDLVFSHVEVKIKWLNTGSSPAINLSTSVTCIPLSNDEKPYLEYFPDFINNASINLGQNTNTTIDVQISERVIADILSCSHNNLAILYSACRYQDIYGNKYQSEYCISIEIPEGILMSFKNTVEDRPLKFSRYGDRNQEITLSSE